MSGSHEWEGYSYRVKVRLGKDEGGLRVKEGCRKAVEGKTDRQGWGCKPFELCG